ncbi:hypothetical protein Hanom_Chr03g00253161 [Helianthus anomalus]
MAETSSPHNVEGENPEPSSPLVAEEEGKGTTGGGLPVLQWTRKSFDRLMRDIQMPPQYGALYPSEGDTGADAPTGYVTMWADFFGDCNLRLPLTVFVVEVLEWYKIHISQLSLLGMIRIRNFESTFRALGIEPVVGDFRRFYQMTVSLGFFSFRQRDGSPKLMAPPKGMTKWKMKFFYIKVVAIVAKMTFRNVTETIITETISVPSLKTVEWFPWLQTIEWVKLSNTQLWVLRMMLTRRNKRSKPVVPEKSGGMMPPYGGCSPRISRVRLKQFFVRMARRSLMLSLEITSGCLLRPHWKLSCRGAKVYLGILLTCDNNGDLGALRDPEAKGVPKRQVVKGVRFRQKKIPEVTVVPHLVPQADELVKAARAGAEQLEKDRAAFEKQKQTAEWAATAQLKQVRTLAKLLSDERKDWNEKISNERKKWNESWAKQNDNLFRARQELTNAKAVNVALVKEKAAAEEVAVKTQQAEALAVKALKEAKETGARAAKALDEAKERESRSSKALEEANAERIRLDKVVASLQAREVTVTDLTARATDAEERASAAVEAKDALTSSFNQLEADREWMRTHGIARIVQAIMDAP